MNVTRIAPLAPPDPVIERLSRDHDASLENAPPVEQPLDLSRAALWAALQHWIAAAYEAPRREALLVRGTPGLGKTTAVFDILKARRDQKGSLARAATAPGPDGKRPPPKVPLILVQRRDLAARVVEKCESRGLRAFVLRARLDHDAAGEPLCRQHLKVQKLYDAGLGRYAGQLCAARDPKSGKMLECPFKDDCAFLAQIPALEAALDNGTVDVVVTTHKKAMMGLPQCLSPWVTIIDEQIDGEFVTTEKLRLERLRIAPDFFGMNLSPHDVLTRHALAGELVAAIDADPKDGVTRFAAQLADEAGLDRLKTARKTIEEALDADMALTPEADLESIERLRVLRQGRKALVAEAALWRTLEKMAARLQQTPEALDQRIALRTRRDAENEPVRELCIGGRRKPPAKLAGAPLIMLDGTGNFDLLKQCFPDHQWTESRLTTAQPNLRCIAVPEASMSTTSLLPLAKASAEDHGKAAALRAKVQHEIAALASRHRRLVVFATQTIIDGFWEQDGWQPPANVETVNYGNQRGRDCFQGADAYYLLGRSHPAPHDLEDLARAYLGDAPPDRPDLCLGPDKRTPQPVRYYMRDDRVYLRKTPQITCPARRTVLDQIAVGALLQAIGRARGAVRPDPATVYVRGTMDLPIRWDAIMSSGELIGERGLFAAAFVRFGGVLPLVPKLMADASEEIFARPMTPDACRSQRNNLSIPGSGDRLVSAHLKITETPALVWMSLKGVRGRKSLFIADGRRGPAQACADCVAFCQQLGYEVRKSVCLEIYRPQPAKSAVEPAAERPRKQVA